MFPIIMKRGVSPLLLLLLFVVSCGPATPIATVTPNEDSAEAEVPVSSAAEPLIAATVEPTVVHTANPPKALSEDPSPSVDAGSGRVLYTLGPDDAPITLIEYSDFQCPFCQRHTVQTMPALKAQFIDTGRVRYEFRDFPIASLHPLAYRLHEAAYCAGDSAGDSAYWQAHDLFFTQAEQFEIGALPALDTAIMAAFSEEGLPDIGNCLLENRFADSVRDNVAAGNAAGVSGTPAFFLNNYKITGAQPLTAFVSAIEAAEAGELEALIAAQSAPPPPAVAAAAPTRAAIQARAKTGLGDPNAPVKIVEFSDYQCPFCQRYALQTMPRIKEMINQGRVYYEFKDFPIASLHPLAYKLHEAALCVQADAGSDGFWMAHDLFFGRAEAFQQSSEPAMADAIASELGQLNLWNSSVEACYSNQTYAAEVEATIAEGAQLGLRGTPSFFIDGYLLVGALPFETFEQAIALAEEDGLGEALRPVQPGANAPAAQPSANNPVDVPLSGSEPAKGVVGAPVTIIEYSSYQCPYCKRHFDQTMPLIQDYIDDGTVRYLFKDFPLPSQPQAFKAHEAARCVDEQIGDEGYWLAHDILFQNQAVWSGTPMGAHTDVIKQLINAADIVEAEVFNNCLDEGLMIDAVTIDYNEGGALGVRGTPAFFINGQFVNGAQPFTVFQQVIEQALQQQQ